MDAMIFSFKLSTVMYTTNRFKHPGLESADSSPCYYTYTSQYLQQLCSNM